MRKFASIFMAVVLPHLAWAEGPGGGIRFDLMPVGCEIHGRYGNGEVRVETYAGKKGGGHVTRSFTAGKLVLTTTYDAKGRMIRKDWAGGKWETFQPFSCFSIPGDCRYRYRNGDGADRQYVGKVVRKGKTYVSSGGFEGDAPFYDSRLTFGPFGNTAALREGNTTFMVIEYRNCGLGS